MEEKPIGEGSLRPIGEVTHYYGGLGVAIVKFKETVNKGEALHFKGAHTDFTQSVDSMQYDHKDIDSAKKGLEVGIKVSEKVREGDEVYRV
jgi:putative protease